MKEHKWWAPVAGLSLNQWPEWCPSNLSARCPRAAVKRPVAISHYGSGQGREMGGRPNLGEETTVFPPTRAKTGQRFIKRQIPGASQQLHPPLFLLFCSATPHCSPSHSLLLTDTGIYHWADTHFHTCFLFTACWWGQLCENAGLSERVSGTWGPRACRGVHLQLYAHALCFFFIVGKCTPPSTPLLYALSFFSTSIDNVYQNCCPFSFAMCISFLRMHKCCCAVDYLLWQYTTGSG